MEGLLDKTTLYTGRKAKIGKTVSIEQDGRQVIGVFIAYCPDCNYKVCLSQNQMVTLTRLYRKSYSTAREKLIRYLIRKIELNGSKGAETQSERVKRHKEYIMQRY